MAPDRRSELAAAGQETGIPPKQHARNSGRADEMLRKKWLHSPLEPVSLQAA
jgi:hypothetical protein